jgi:G3E family GTPase
MKARIDVISGFLGAGKTTLILEMLKGIPEGERLAVCENEYGEVGIDGDVLKSQNLEVLEINAGCVCCTLSYNLVAGIKLLVARYHPTRILLEPTGLASLAEILNILRDEDLEKLITIGTPAAVVDGGAMLKGYERFRRFYESLLATATVVFLNRTEALDDGQKLELAALIQGINPAARLVAEPFDSSGIWDALDMPQEASAAAPAALPKAWLEQFKQLSVQTGWRGSKERLEQFIQLGLMQGEVIRAKGYVYDKEGARFRADFSGGQWELKPTGEGGLDCLQLIGRNLPMGTIKQQFAYEGNLSLSE